LWKDSFSSSFNILSPHLAVPGMSHLVSSLFLPFFVSFAMCHSTNITYPMLSFHIIARLTVLACLTLSDWSEIKEWLKPGQVSSNRPDLGVQHFRLRLEELRHNLFEEHALGKVAGSLQSTFTI
jgi:hypothetical protein